MYDYLKLLEFPVTVLNPRIGKHMSENMSTSPKQTRSTPFSISHLWCHLRKTYWVDAEIN